MREIRATAFELVRCAQGNPTVFRDSEGEEVRISLHTPETFVEATVAARKSLGLPMTDIDLAQLRREAQRLTAPLGYPSV